MTFDFCLIVTAWLRCLTAQSACRFGLDPVGGGGSLFMVHIKINLWTPKIPRRHPETQKCFWDLLDLLDLFASGVK